MSLLYIIDYIMIIVKRQVQVEMFMSVLLPVFQAKVGSLIYWILDEGVVPC